MDQTVVITLRAETTTLDEIKQEVISYTDRDVYAQLRSITQTEWFEAGRNGLKPDIAFRLSQFEYADERLVIWDNVLYGVYRVYKGRNDVVELYCERKGGLNKDDK